MVQNEMRVCQRTDTNSHKKSKQFSNLNPPCTFDARRIKIRIIGGRDVAGVADLKRRQLSPAVGGDGSLTFGKDVFEVVFEVGVKVVEEDVVKVVFEVFFGDFFEDAILRCCVVF